MVAARKVRWAVQIKVELRARRVTRALRLVKSASEVGLPARPRLRKVSSYWWRNSSMVKRLGKMRHAMWAGRANPSFR